MHIDKFKKNPYLAAAVFFLILFCSSLLFALAVKIKITPEPDGFGDGKGPNIFGKGGDGNGTGDGSGDGSHSGSFKGVGDSEGNGKSSGDSKKDSELKNENTAKNQKGQKNSAPESKTDGKDSENADNSKQSETPKIQKLRGAKIYADSDKAKKVKKKKETEIDLDDSAEQGSKGFTSGGRSVFRIKRNKNILFIVDISPSMDAETAERLTRITILKDQLIHTIKKLNKEKSKGLYSILAFSSNCYSYPDKKSSKQLKFSSAADINSTEKWISQMEKLPRAGTYLYKAISTALTMINQNGIKVDIIFILTDGEPNDEHQTDVYLKLLSRELPENIVINTISIGTSSPLLQEIAKQHKGKYDEYK
ncbi:MAG: VWA domain-containing protein [Lentisphaeria bacterium]|nr:VWA domain-containing protein [Lentisphaeria bacterium]